MQLTGELKEKVEKAETKEEAKKTIEEAGMILDDAELDQVAGGDEFMTRREREMVDKFFARLHNQGDRQEMSLYHNGRPKTL